MSGATPGPPDGLAPGLVPLYEEAVAVADRSPASACALLRLLLRNVVVAQGRPGRHLARDVEEAVMGAPSILRALDAIGLGEERSRHPGAIDLAQGHTDVQDLVVLVHLVVDHLGGPTDR